jgi:hypothetical protein
MRYQALWTPFMLLCFMLGGLSAGRAELQLVNPDFAAATDKEGLPDGWRKYVSPNGQAKVSTDPSVQRSGNGAVRVELADQSRCALSQWLTLTDEGPLTFGCFVRAAEAVASTTAQVQLQWFRELHHGQVWEMVRSDSSPAVPVTSGWVNLAVAATRPPDATRALVVVAFGNQRTVGGTFWATDAYLQPNLSPQPLLSNGGFELTAPDSDLPAGWVKSSYGEGFELIRDTEVFKAGQASAKLTGLPGHGSRLAMTQTTSLMPVPKTLRVKLWYRGQGKADGIIDILPPVGVTGSMGGVYFDRIVFDLPRLSDEWQQIVLERDLTDEARTTGQMRLNFILYQKGEGDLWYDEIEVEFVD